MLPVHPVRAIDVRTMVKRSVVRSVEGRSRDVFKFLQASALAHAWCKAGIEQYSAK